MVDFYGSVKDFHISFEQPVRDLPVIPGPQERNLRMALLEEEYKEYLTAEMDNDLVEIADALADMIYIICGTACAYGIPLDKVFEEVHNSNMAKLVDGKVLKREDGKVIKPEGWEAPNIRKILYPGEAEVHRVQFHGFPNEESSTVDIFTEK